MSTTPEVADFRCKAVDYEFVVSSIEYRGDGTVGYLYKKERLPFNKVQLITNMNLVIMNSTYKLFQERANQSVDMAIDRFNLERLSSDLTAIVKKALIAYRAYTIHDTDSKMRRPPDGCYLIAKCPLFDLYSEPC